MSARKPVQNPITPMVVGADDRTPAAECSCSGPSPSGWHESCCATVLAAAGGTTPTAEPAAWNPAGHPHAFEEFHGDDTGPADDLCGYEITDADGEPVDRCGWERENPVHQPAEQAVDG